MRGPSLSSRHLQKWLLLAFTLVCLGHTRSSPTRQWQVAQPSGVHPFHVGLAELHIDSQGVQLAIRVFTDDLEMALGKRFRTGVDLAHGDSLSHAQMIQNLLRETVTLTADRQAVQFAYIGREWEEDAVWLYLEGDFYRRATEWALKITLLSELFPDQRYVTRIHQYGQTGSQLLSGPEFRHSWTTSW
jgi:hypothetical protein